MTFAPTRGEAPAPLLPVAAQPSRRLGGRYELGSPLGQGGMGVVYEARDLVLRRSVAVKMIHTKDTISASKIQRFRREAELTSQLQHPNIIPLYDFLQDEDGAWFFVMKKIEGNTLRWILDGLASGDRVLRADWDRHRLLSLLLTVCQAVGYAHQRKVLHRDIKAENIMIGPLGEVYVMDWGIARIVDQVDVIYGAPETVDLAQTRYGSVIGTASYMSPEQADGRLDQIRPHSDVWSLGILLARVLIHGVLYIPPVKRSRSDPAQRPVDIARELLETLRTSASDAVSEDVIALCESALRPDPDARFPDAVAMASAVQRVLSGEARRQRAAVELQTCRAELARFKAIRADEQRLEGECEALSEAVISWKPLTDPTKVALRQREQELQTCRAEQAGHFSSAVVAGELALSHDPGSRDARALLSEAFWHAYERAERDKDQLNRSLYASRLRTLAVPRFCRLLDGDGTLSLSTSPPRADVISQRFEQSGLVWPLGEPTWLGRTPLRDVPMAPGSYLLTLRAPGYADVRYPVLISRACHWSGEGVRLLRPEQIPDGMVYVAAGPATFGDEASSQTRYWPPHEATLPGFFMARFPVTAEQYIEFLNDLPREEANRRRPREDSAGSEEPVWFWAAAEPGTRFSVPEGGDLQDTRWQPQWPVCGVGWDDAVAYAAWKARKTGLPYRLPSEHEWEKAARGVDARRYVWGDSFDYTLCKLERSRPGGTMIEPVGAFPTDCSVYGVRDMVGSMRDWTADHPLKKAPAHFRAIRGGGWSTTSITGVTYNRYPRAKDDAACFTGFRLALDLPKEE